MQLRVRKTSGELEVYSEEKVRHSIAFSGLPLEAQQNVISIVEKRLYDGIPTSEIHRYIANYIRSTFPRALGKLNMKQAIMALGPTGFPFEQYVARLMNEYGYRTTVGVIMPGACVSHEVDVYAQKAEKEYFIECKYHNQPGQKTDVKVVLYVKARADDLAQYFTIEKKTGIRREPWIFTNTKFSKDALHYAMCKNIRLTGWGYPEGKSLNSMIEAHRLYPVTMLMSISHDVQQRLLMAGVVLVSDISRNGGIVKQLALTTAQDNALREEIDFLSTI